MERWTVERAWEWYNSRPFIRGCNYMSAGCVNRVDQWQSLHFDEHLAEREKKFSEQFQRMVSNAESNPMMRSMLETTKKKAIDSYESINQWFLERKIGGVAYDDYIKTAEKTKEDNLEKLKQLGII